MKLKLLLSGNVGSSSYPIDLYVKPDYDSSGSGSFSSSYSIYANNILLDTTGSVSSIPSCSANNCTVKVGSLEAPSSVDISGFDQYNSTYTGHSLYVYSDGNISQGSAQIGQQSYPLTAIYLKPDYDSEGSGSYSGSYDVWTSTLFLDTTNSVTTIPYCKHDSGCTIKVGSLEAPSSFTLGGTYNAYNSSSVLYIYTDGNIDTGFYDFGSTSTAFSAIYLYPDYDNNSTAQITSQADTFSANIYIDTVSALTVNSITPKNLQGSTTLRIGTIEAPSAVTVTPSLANYTGTLYVYSDGNITMSNDLGSTGSDATAAYFWLDKDGNGTGTFTNNADIFAENVYVDATGALVMSTVSFKDLQTTPTLHIGTIQTPSAITLSAMTTYSGTIYAYSNGNITMSGDIGNSSGAITNIYFWLDKDGNGTGTFTTGGYDLYGQNIYLDATGALVLSETSFRNMQNDITVRTGTIDAPTAITMSNMGTNVDNLYMYSDGNITLGADIGSSGTPFTSAYIWADKDNNGAGSLSFSSYYVYANTLYIDQDTALTIPATTSSTLLSIGSNAVPTSITTGGNLAVTSGNLTMIASGAITSTSYSITTTSSGNISLTAEGASSALGTVNSAGSITLAKRTTSATYTAGAVTLTAATDLNINAGATLNASNASANLVVGDDLTIAAGATLSAPAANDGSFTVAGDWANSGTFTHNSGKVTLVGTGQKIFGNNTFYSLTKDISSASADTLMFENTKTQTLAASGTLTLTGASGKVLTLRSMNSGGTQSDGTEWMITVNGNMSIAYVNVKDSDASGGSAISHTNSTNSGNNTNWGFNTAPSLTSVAVTPSIVAGGNEITITPTGQADAESDTLYFYCNESDSATSADTLCSEANTGYTSAYGSMTCTYNAPSGAGTNTVYCRTYDGTAYSTERTNTYQVTQAPTFTSISNSPSIAGAGADIAFISDASDPDGDDITLYVCKANDFTGSACGAGGTWCSSSAASSDPTCSYTVVSGDGTATQTYYANIIDSHNAQSSDNSRSGTFDTDVSALIASGFSPSNGATTDTNPFVTFAINRIGDCRVSTVDRSYDQMTNDTDCTGDGSTNISCRVPAQTIGSHTIYFACQDYLGNKNSSSDNFELTYAMTQTSGGSGVYPSGTGPAPISTPENTVIDTVTQIPTFVSEQIQDIISTIIPWQPNPPAPQNNTPAPAGEASEEVIATLPSNIVWLIEKFPSLGDNLSKLNVGRPVNLPSLTSILKSLTAGISVANLPFDELSKIPTDFLFIGTANNTIGLATQISLTKEKNTVSSVKLINNEIINLTVRPSKKSQGITGKVILNSINATTKVNNKKTTSLIPIAHAIELPDELESATMDGKEFVINEFTFKENTNGLYTASIQTPAVAGIYEIKTTIKRQCWK